MEKAFLIIVFALVMISCGQNETDKIISRIYSDTLNLNHLDITVEIDTLNSGITLNLNEIKELQDSIIVSFDESFESDSVILIHNQRNLYKDILISDGSTGFASNAKFKRNKKGNTFDLRIKGNRYVFTEKNKFNFIHIYYYKDLEVVFTNKGYIYD